MPYDMQKQFFDPLMEMTKYPLNSVKDIVKTIPTKGKDMKSSKNYVILKVGFQSYIAPYNPDNLNAARAFMNRFVETDIEGGVYRKDSSRYRKTEIKLVSLTDNEIDVWPHIQKTVSA